jgi:ABC-type multidrug transport system permease subunit
MSSLPGELQLQLVPRTLALVVVFLPFVLVVRSYSREIAFGTLPILLATLRGGWGKIAAAKISVAIWLVMIAFLFLLPVIRLIFGFIPKPGLSSTVGVQILAMFISASFGLMAAIVARNETQVHIAMGVYFLFLVLLSGFLFPLETAAPIVQLASYGNPMTFSSKLLEYWLFYGTEPSMFWWDISCLLAQCAVVTALLGISITFARWRV